MSTEDRTPTPSAGAFSGAASQVWTWLALHRVLGEDRLLERAAARAVLLEGRLVEDDVEVDLLNGAAGGIVPLLNLASATGQERWLAAAAQIGRRLTGLATVDASGCPVDDPAQPGGHRRLRPRRHRHRLGADPARPERRGCRGRAARLGPLAELAFAYQESLYQPDHGNWLDVRIGAEEDFFTSWCHGSAGIGVGMLDLHRRTGDPAHLDMARRAARACAAEGFWLEPHPVPRRPRPLAVPHVHERRRPRRPRRRDPHQPRTARPGRRTGPRGVLPQPHVGPVRSRPHAPAHAPFGVPAGSPCPRLTRGSDHGDQGQRLLQVVLGDVRHGRTVGEVPVEQP
ncbi:hypothetical protein O1M54_48915 [Streptomyces diastatochromogenes]|nr:hypothetical protein [Streptomyces diastatochromogenes]